MIDAIILVGSIAAQLLSLNPAPTGVATVYEGERWEGNLLYCDYAMPGELRYREETGVWFAFDVEEYASGRISCGDSIRLEFADGTILEGKALDAGTFQGYWVSTYGPHVPIIVDVPGLWWPYSERLSQLVTIVAVENHALPLELD